MHLLDRSLPLRMPPVPPRSTAVAVDRAVLERLVGTYELAPTFVLDVILEGDALWVQPTGQPRTRLWASAPNRYFLREVDAQLVFELGASGPATAATLIQNGAERKAPRRTQSSPQ